MPKTSNNNNKLQHQITITQDWVTGETRVHWGDIRYTEAFGMLEFAKLLLYEDYLEGGRER